LTLLAEPDKSRYETQEAQVSGSQLVEAREDASVVLDLADEALDQVALLVYVPVDLTLFFAAAARPDDRLRASLFDTLDEVRRVVTGIGYQRPELVSLDERLGLRDVVTLAARQSEPERQAEPVNAQVNLGGEAAATPA
jgi:hypothetical protein